MTGRKLFKKTMFVTLIVFLVFGIIYTLIWWLIFDRKFYPIKQFENFIFPFSISRWYDFGLICFWPIIIAPLFFRDKDDGDVPLFNILALVGGFAFIGLSLVFWLKAFGFKEPPILTIIAIIVGWIITENFFFNTPDKRPGIGIYEYDRKKIITEGFTSNVLGGLGAAFAFIFYKGLLVGLFFGSLATIALTVLLLINNLVLKSLCRAIVKSDPDKKLITKVE